MPVLSAREINAAGGDPLVRGAASLSGHRLIINGDSKAQTAGAGDPRAFLYWALARYPVDLFYDVSVDNLAVYGGLSDETATLGAGYGGVQKPIGMLHPTRLAELYARIDAGADVAILFIGANDLPLAVSDLGIIGNILKYVTLCRARGIKRHLIMSVDPRGSQNATMQGVNAATNRALGELARVTPDIVFVDTGPIMLIADNTGYLPASGVLIDGVHETAATGYRKAEIVGQALRSIMPAKPPRTFAPDAYNATTNRNGNLVTGARFAGTGGIKASLAGTVTGLAPSGWEFLGGNAGLTIDFSQVAWAAGNTRFGRNDLMACRLRITGTPAANGYVGARASIPSITGGDVVQAQFCFQATASTGLWGAGFWHGSTQTGILNSYLKAGNYLAGNALPALDGFFQLEAPFPYTFPTPTTNVNTWFGFDFASGVPIDATIDLVSYSLFKTPALVPTP